MLINGERAMAYVVKIDDLQPIEGADFIEKAIVGGWNVVVKKGDFSINDLAVYCEIDSWIPHSIAPFLTQDGHFPKVYNEVEGQRLKTKRLKGVVSQGLLLPLISGFFPKSTVLWLLEEGDDITKLLGIQKWEKPIPAEMRGVMKGNFPSFIPKTDQERVQNLTKVLPNYYGMSFEATEKLHGSSMTVYASPFEDSDCGAGIEFGVCSRNVDLKPSETNTYWKTAYDQKLFDILFEMRTNYNCHYALQGELIGEGINGNMYGIKGHQFRLFDIYNITEQRYLTPVERSFMWILCNRNATEMHTPILNSFFVLNEIYTAEKLLQMVEHKSTLNGKVWVEGWVLKCNDADFSFKVVSNKFLTSKEGEDA